MWAAYPDGKVIIYLAKYIFSFCKCLSRIYLHCCNHRFYSTFFPNSHDFIPHFHELTKSADVNWLLYGISPSSWCEFPQSFTSLGRLCSFWWSIGFNSCAGSSWMGPHGRRWPRSLPLLISWGCSASRLKNVNRDTQPLCHLGGWAWNLGGRNQFINS